MGLGKFILQSFLQYPNLKKVVGVELAQSRYEKGEAAVQKLVSSVEGFEIAHLEVRKNVAMRTKSDNRTLEMRRANFFEVQGINEADIVILETKINPTKYGELTDLLQRLKSGTKLLTYENLTEVYAAVHKENPFIRLPINEDSSDRFKTSWDPDNGHHFYLWTKSAKAGNSFDLFLSHRQINGADLAQSIKLQLAHLRPDLDIFLDVDDLNNVHNLEVSLPIH